MVATLPLAEVLAVEVEHDLGAALHDEHLGQHLVRVRGRGKGRVRVRSKCSGRGRGRGRGRARARARA